MGRFDSRETGRKSGSRAAAVIGTIFCIALTLAVLTALLKGSGDTRAPVGTSGAQMALMDRIDMAVGNAVSDALDGVLTMDKV